MIFRKLLNLFNRKKYDFRIPKESAVIYFFYINFYNNHYLQEIIQGNYRKSLVLSRAIPLLSRLSLSSIFQFS